MKVERMSRMALLVSCALAPLSLATTALAQAPAPAASGEVEEVVVTGSRIVTNGFQAPTPVTTLTNDALLERTPTNVADALNQLPQFKDSASPQTSVTWQTTTPNQGNFLNLRGLGSQRTLILLDGIRVPPTSYTGAVDVNTLPQALMVRTDVVTGGASAAYGSDAVTGVVNFILDRNFNGIKGSVQAGTSRYGDNDSYRGTIAAGRPLFGGRGHIEGSAEYFRSFGIESMADRRGGTADYFWEGNGTAQYPRYLVSNVKFGTSSFGGKIISGPLNDFRFQPDGSVVPFVHGTPVIIPTATRLTSTTFEIGGDGVDLPFSSLNSELRTTQFFSRFDFDVTDSIHFHAQGAFAESRSFVNMFASHNLAPGTTAITIFADNAYLRPDVRSRLGTTTSFTVSRVALDMPPKRGSILTDATNINVGFDGRVGETWRWDATYVFGNSYLRNKSYETFMPRFYAAVDAVRDPGGNIVCRVTLTNPGLYPGCVPMNIMGVGAPSAAANDYTFAWSQWQVINRMHIAALNVSGELFDLWAGPVSVAAGAEYRENKLIESSNGDPAKPVSFAGLRGMPNGVQTWNYTNVGAAFGVVNVKEVYGELGVPLLKNVPFVQSLDLSAALRVTDYSTSGTVETWKVGFTYQPFNDLRIRATQSRDIAAPSLYQLYAGQQAQAANFSDIHTNITGPLTTITSGNAALTPEIGSMVVAGFVYQPSWLSGFQVSFDAYQLVIQDAIGNSNAGGQNNDCEISGGIDPACALIIRPGPFSDRSPANFPTRIFVSPLNLAKTYQSGFDIELAYTTPLERIIPSSSGDVSFRMYATHLQHQENKNGRNIALSTESAGAGGNPKWRGSLEMSYRNGPLRFRVAERFTGSTKKSFTQFYTSEYKRNPNRTYTDVSGSYAFGGQEQYEGFFSISNLFNAKGPFQGATTNPGLVYPVDKGFYDVVGTQFNLGLRFRR